MSNCIFCKIANKEIPGKIIYEDDLCIAFLDLSQTTIGHTLVIPKAHYESFLEVEEDTLKHIITIAKTLANKLMDKLDAKGINILSNAKVAAGQTVMHFHIHIIPRYDENDGISITFTDHSKDVNLDDIYQKIMG